MRIRRHHGISSLLCISLFVYLLRHEKKKMLRSEKNVILAAWYLGQPDAQAAESTHFKPSNSYTYMRNFYESATFLDLPVIVFHDHLSPLFERAYTTDKFKFHRTGPPPRHISPQDWRFFRFAEFLSKEPLYDNVIFADLSDSFFFHDPFAYMRDRQEHLFITRDVGTLHNNMWMREKFLWCYNISNLPNRPVYNDGVWGGKTPMVYEFLTCFTDHLEKKAPYENCNMMAMNVCANKRRYQRVMEDPTSISNPYLKECGNTKYPIIHNKCIKLDPEGDWNNKCVVIKDNKVDLISC